MALSRYKSFADRKTLQAATAARIAAGLMESINAKGKASLFLSGGSTPGPVYEALSEVDLPWDKVDVGLVDERWVDEDDEGSNATLIRRTLLRGAAGKANFTPMKTDHVTPQAGQDVVAKLYKPLLQTRSIAILGMGTDGHVCSWFPQSAGLTQALDPANPSPVQAIKARQSEVTGTYLDRMTLTYSAVAACDTVILLITGEAKRAVIDRALNGEGGDLPVSRLLSLKPEQFSIYYAA